ncbi:MAG TPA: class I SAM-dependent methyltransferase [Jatrophihabitans sp.]|nr:class I SAM-dependent methyltransferase [Jatrophihabitans sp.]
MTSTAQLKEYQKAAWSAGDYVAVAGATVIASELLVAAVDVRPGDRVLDAACGSGNAMLAAARRFAEVTALDFSPAMLAEARHRAGVERTQVRLVEGDLESLPFPDGYFDVVLSAFGAMFSPDQVRTAAELARVCRPGGRIGIASWTAEGALGQLFSVAARHVPATPGVASPTAWGDPDQLAMLFGAAVTGISCTRRQVMFCYHSPEHWMRHFKDHFGPTRMMFSILPARLAEPLERELIGMWDGLNQATDGRLVAPVEYLEAVLTTSN